MKLTWRFAALVFLGLTAFCASLPAQTSHAGPEGDERILFESANRERAARHLSPLHWDDKLARAARDHAALMARMGAISHQFSGEPGLSARVSRAGLNFTLVAENVGMAERSAELHDLWMKSPPHRANLLEPKSDAVGIAVSARNGLLYAVEDFARVVSKISLEEQEHRVGTLLGARGLRIVATTGAVRQTCALSRGMAPGMHPKYLFRYVTADIANLPDELLDEIIRHRGEYQAAAVGACTAFDTEGFDGFRLAVLLY